MRYGSSVISGNGGGNHKRRAIYQRQPGGGYLSDSTLSDDSTSEAEFKTGYAVSGALGYKFAESFRLEGEVGYRYHDFDSIDGESASDDLNVSNLSFLANAYYDFQSNQSFTPYLGAGLGASNVEINTQLDGAAYEADDTVFAYALMAGVSFPVSTSTSLGVEYKYLGTTDANIGGVKVEYDSHSIGAKLSYHF